MKRIIINGRFLIHRVTGVERYAREIVAELDKIVKPGEFIIAVPPEAENIPNYKNIRIEKIGKLKNRLWEHVSFPLYVVKNHAVSLNLCNAAPLLSPGIVCIHDVKVKATPQYFSKKFLAWYNLLFTNITKRAKKIITVSNFSKNEIIKYYNVESDRIMIIPNAWQHYERIGYDENSLNRYGLKKDEYYFSICSLEPNKNFKWIAEMAKRTPECIFAVAGSINDTVFQKGLGFKCPINMKLLGYISDEEAKTLMRDCKAFLFPTFYEGFGIPPLEAISSGCKKIVVSDTEVMHEIYGDSVNYVDPNEYCSDISNLKIVNTDILERYSWEKSASDLVRMIRGMR